MKDYIELAMRTAAPGDLLLHCAMGLVTETVEMETADTLENYLEEAGDTMWYVAIGCHYLQVTLEEAEESAPSEDLKPFMIAGNFMNLMKRQVFYGKAATPFDLMSTLGSMIATLRAEVRASGSSLETVMEENIAKLRKRYPARFTEHHAINR